MTNFIKINIIKTNIDLVCSFKKKPIDFYLFKVISGKKVLNEGQKNFQKFNFCLIILKKGIFFQHSTLTDMMQQSRTYIQSTKRHHQYHMKREGERNKYKLLCIYVRTCRSSIEFIKMFNEYIPYLRKIMSIKFVKKQKALDNILDYLL